jgi:hypothetical protein
MVKQLEHNKKKYSAHLCFGVSGRGDADESLWEEKEKDTSNEEDEELDPWEHPDVATYPNGRKSLQLWEGQHLQTTPCSNVGSVIEFFFVPFIVEEYEDEEESAVNSGSESSSVETMTETDQEL